MRAPASIFCRLSRFITVYFIEHHPPLNRPDEVKLDAGTADTSDNSDPIAMFDADRPELRHYVALL